MWISALHLPGRSNIQGGIQVPPYKTLFYTKESLFRKVQPLEWMLNSGRNLN